MTNWIYKDSDFITYNGDCITIKRLNRSKDVSDFIRIIEKSIIKKGLKSVKIIFDRKGGFYPNAVVPVSGIIQYLQNELKINVEIDNKGDNEWLNIIKPHRFDVDGRYVLNRVWIFSSSEEVAKIVDSYILELQKSAKFYKGVLNAIEWSLNEVMDNVIQHSKTGFGYVMGQLHSSAKNIAFTVFDTGQGIFNSMKDSIHHPQNTIDAITLAIKEEVTRDKSIGQGNGLFGLHSIVQQGKGKLVITSGPGSYILYNDGIAKTFDRLPSLSKETPGTIVDFQLNYANDMSLDKALVFRGKQYELINLHLEELEDDYGRIVYNVLKHSEGTGTRESAVRVKNEILNILSEHQKPIVLDFSEVAVISSSFADELLAKLMLSLGLFNFNNLIKIKGLDMSQQNILQRSVLQRIAEDVQGNKPSSSTENR